MLGVCEIIYLSGDLSDSQIITFMHIHSIVKLVTTKALVLTNTEMWKVGNPTILAG